VAAAEPYTIRVGPDCGAVAFGITAPLDVAGVPYAWEPYPPADMPTGNRGRIENYFTLMVPQERLDEARDLLSSAVPDYVAESMPGEPPAPDQTMLGLGESASRSQERSRPVQPLSDVDAEFVDDPEALAEAEDQVRNVSEDRERYAYLEPDDGLVTILRNLPYDKKRLYEIAFALWSEGIEVEWRPFDPANAPLMQLFVLHETRFDLRVGADRAHEARAIVAQADPQRGRSAE
jgi:hypothetical protein